MRKLTSIPPGFISFASLFAVSSCFALLTACTSSSSVPLQPTNPAPTNQNQGSGQPTSSPTPTPKPGTTPTPTPVLKARTVARIYCEPFAPIENPYSTFESLPADADSGFPISSIDFFNVAGLQAVAVKSPVPLTGFQTLNEASSNLILQARESSTQNPIDGEAWKIYHSKVDLLSYKGDLQVLSNYGDTSFIRLNFAYKKFGLTRKILAANSQKTSIVYPNDRGIYVVQNLKTGATTSLGLSAETYSNPVFTGQDEWVKFDQFASSGFTQKLISIRGQKTRSLPSAQNSGDSQLFAYLNAQQILYWIEGSPGNGWKWRSSASSGSRLEGNVRGLVLPMVFFEMKGRTVLAYAEEVQNAQGTRLDTGALHLIAPANRGQDQTLKYPEMLLDVPFSKYTRDVQGLRGLFYEPISETLHAAFIANGGMVGYDLNTNQWQLNGAGKNGIFACMNPDWGIEVIHE